MLIGYSLVEISQSHLFLEINSISNVETLNIRYMIIFFSTWAAKEGPKRDSYNISDNPQYRLEIKSSQPAAVWILLTRHITDKVCCYIQSCFLISNSFFITYMQEVLIISFVVLFSDIECLLHHIGGQGVVHFVFRRNLIYVLVQFYTPALQITLRDALVHHFF